MEKETLNRYFSGEATREEQEQVLDWVDASEENRKELEKERLLFDIALFSTHKDVVRKRLSSTIRISMGIAASIAVILCCYFLVSNYKNEEHLQWQSVVAPAGQKAQVTLTDGTKIWLSSKTTLRYPSNFGHSNRDVTLDGEAYFEVAKNKKLPFIVQTEHNKVQVVGTHFNICAYNGSNNFETTLTEGIVDIYELNSDIATARLTKDERYSEVNGVGTKSKISSLDFLMWREGIYCFDDMSFPAIATKLERYYNVKITILNPAMMNYRCTGKFNEQDGIIHLLKVIQQDCSFKFTFDQQKRSIIIK